MYSEHQYVKGRVAVPILGEYAICCVRDAPPLVTSLVTSTVGPGPFSAKAVGEAGISIVAPAVANAVYDAMGIRIMELPIAAEKLYTELTSSEFRSGANVDKPARAPLGIWSWSML